MNTIQKVLNIDSLDLNHIKETIEKSLFYIFGLCDVLEKETNTIEGFNRQLRKVTKNKAVFPTDDALKKTLYLCTQDIVKKWSMPYRDWGETYGQFVIEFGDRARIS